MGLERSLVVVAYDTPVDKRRRKIVRAAMDFADRVQRSVFEGRLTASQRQKLWATLERIAVMEEDSVRLYSLCQRCQQEARAMGGPFVELPGTAWTI